MYLFNLYLIGRICLGSYEDKAVLLSFSLQLLQRFLFALVFLSATRRHKEVQLYYISKVPYQFNNCDLAALTRIEFRNYQVRENVFE